MIIPILELDSVEVCRCPKRRQLPRIWDASASPFSLAKAFARITDSIFWDIKGEALGLLDHAAEHPEQIHKD